MESHEPRFERVGTALKREMVADTRTRQSSVSPAASKSRIPSSAARIVISEAKARWRMMTSVEMEGVD
jgi:hypothetical protein